MERQERRAASPQLPADEDVSRSAGQTHINQPGTQRHSELQQPGTPALQLDFQDSNMSPALSLLPGVDHNLTEFSLLQQSETEFAPLRPYPDVSMASEQFQFSSKDPRMSHAHTSEHGSLSQHPLAQASILSEEGESSCCSLSQHSLSTGEQSKLEAKVHPQVIAIETGIREKDPETLNKSGAKLEGEPAEDETFFLSKNIPAQHLLQLLQKDVGMLSSSSSAASSASETSVKRTGPSTEESKSTEVCKLITQQSSDVREHPPGEASFPQQQTQQQDKVSDPDQPQTVLSELSNITVGSRSTQPDQSSEMLHRELLSEVEKRSRIEADSKNKPQKRPTPPGPSLSPYLKQTSEGKPSASRTNVVGMQWTGPFSTGVEQVCREHDLWSSENHTGLDGSYLGFLPQSQSTPGIFNAPTKSNVKAKLRHLSSIESNKQNSYQPITEISLQRAFPVVSTHNTDTATQCQEDAASAKVQSLPSLNYMQKVDAWRANQSSDKMSLFDNLSLQGFSSITSKQKGYDAVSDSVNRLVSQKSRSLHQPLVSAAATQTSTAPSGSSSPRRMEAVGSAHADEENTGSAVPPSASPLGRSQSHSSLSTVVMSVQNDQQIDRPSEREKSQGQDNDARHRDQTNTIQTSHLTSLGHFSDVSLDRDLTLSSSQDSYGGKVKLGASIGTSSVVSLEIDNYVPSWTSKLSTPPPLAKPRELNIDERIPLYLHNLGIDQSPSTILTPFVPRGPIREPEFSPTEFCTIKGSTGTPTKSTQPSEGGSPHKDEFSQSSIRSVDSSVSIPLSLDSLCPGATLLEQARRTSPTSDTEARQSKHKLAPYTSPDENTHSSTLQPCQQQKDGSLSSSWGISQLEDKFNADMLPVRQQRAADGHRERSLESLLQMSHSANQSAEDSFVRSKALLEIRKLVSHADTMISTGSSAASSTSSIAPRLLPDQDISPSLKRKTSRLQDFSSSSTTGDHRTSSSLLWTRSFSDSMLTSEKMRQSSFGQKGVNRSLQSDYPCTQAVFTAPPKVTYKAPQDGTVSDAGTSLVLSKSAFRTEPEGCSAAPPDKAPTQPAAIKPPPAASTQELTLTPTDSVDVPEDEEEITPSEDASQSRSFSPILKDAEEGVLSDGSCESSLTAKVAKLLQSESPSTMVSSTPSISDQEESKAREWIKLKLSGQQCEPLRLDEEDRRRIEEIKRELLLKNPIKSQFSTDTESSAASSVKISRELDPPQSAETFAVPRDAINEPNQVLHSLSRTTRGTTRTQLQTVLQFDLEARVCEIAAREGVTLPTKKPQVFTSIAIATHRSSTSPFPSNSTSSAPHVSPATEPLRLTELSTGAVRTTTAPTEEHGVALLQTTTGEPSLLHGPSSSLHSTNQYVTSQFATAKQKRQDTEGGQFQEPLPSSQGLDKEDVTARDNSTQSFTPDSKLSAFGMGVGHVSDQATGSSAVETFAHTGDVSHVHLTLSPKATDPSFTSIVYSSQADAISGLPPKEFFPLRHSPSAASSPDEGVGLSSPPEWGDSREPLQQRPPERSDSSAVFKTVVPQERMTTTSTQSFTPHERSEISTRPFTTKTTVPVLLPYKPHGSEEVFYVPHTEADLSSTEPSDTTMESTHTGSDDAVPPRFSTDVLGNKDPGFDRGVTIRHTEGIYSKRLKTASLTMLENRQRDASTTANESLQTASQRLKPSSQGSVAFIEEHLQRNQETFKRDQGTSPIQFPQHHQRESHPDRLQPCISEMDYGKGNTQQGQTSDPQTGSEQQSRGSDRPLDQLWQKFCDQWTTEEMHPTSDREVSLLERLERLSRLIQSARGFNVFDVQKVTGYHPEQKQERKREDVTKRRKELKQTLVEIKRSVEGEVREDGRKVIQPSIGVDETCRSTEDSSHASLTSSVSHSSSQSQHASPRNRHKSETLSTMSGSMSTVDTARMIRAFGPDKVRHLKSTPSLSKLYNTINKQKEERKESGGRSRKPPHTSKLPVTTSTDQSVADSSSTSTYTMPSHHEPSRSRPGRKAVKLVNKSIQAGDLEIVHNGTRRHTRDVGTTFPSPGNIEQISFSSSSVVRERGGQRSKRTPPKPYPEAVSWFISTDGLLSEARKENQPEEERPSIIWFEPYSRINPWRQPLRQRQVHEDTNKHHAEPDSSPKHITMSSGPAHMSLQEALEMRRPEFISRSMQRVNRLILQVEERKLQAAFNQEGGCLFNHPGGVGRPTRPAGTALLQRAVPRKEMIQRSKQIYENLPEVQRRREEERRKAEHHTYRLNAQLFNKRITNRVLGRRSAWQ